MGFGWGWDGEGRAALGGGLTVECDFVAFGGGDFVSQAENFVV